MITLVLANNKGGVGKTTSALNIADALVVRGYSVLLIDGDQQANLSQSFAYTPPVLNTLAGVLRGSTALAEAVQEVRAGLYLLPAGADLNDAVADRAKQPGAELALRKLLAPLRIDFTIIDTPGALGKLTDMALAAATAVFIPVHPEAYGIAGLVKLIRRCQLMQENVNPGLRVAGLFLTQYHPNDRRVILKKNIEDMRANPILAPLFMLRTIRENVAVKEAQSLCQSLQAYSPDCTAALDYTLLTAEVLNRLHRDYFTPNRPPTMTTISKKDLFGSVKLDELSQPLRGARPDVLIPFSSKLRFSTLVGLKQAMHHLGAVEQDFIDAAVTAALEKLPEADQPLPAPKQTTLDQLLRKIQG